MGNKTVWQVLTGARALLARGWAQGATALDCDGNITDPQSDRAVRFCLEGAIRRASGWHVTMEGGHSAALVRRVAMSAVWDAIADSPDPTLAFVRIPPWNDAQNRTHAEVLAVIDRAIVKARVCNLFTDAAPHLARELRHKVAAI